MTVKELIDAAPFCDVVEIVVRKEGHGQWIQGYRVGSRAQIYPSEVTAEIRELKGLKEYHSPSVPLNDGEIIDFEKYGLMSRMKMRVICKSCHKVPDYIGRLEVCEFMPRHVPSFHKGNLYHNDFSMEINCYPDNYAPMIEAAEAKTEQLPGQMSIEEFLEVKDEFKTESKTL